MPLPAVAHRPARRYGEGHASCKIAQQKILNEEQETLREGSIRGLRAFCAAARHLSFRAAAEELCVTPSAVSHQVKALEDRLHGALFERRARSLVLTQLGLELRDEVEPLLNELDNIATRFEHRLGRRRVLRIGVRDGSTTPPRLRSPEPHEPGGRGVQFLERCSRRWGVEVHDGEDEPSGKTVWFELLTAG